MCDQGVGCGFFFKKGQFSVIFESQDKEPFLEEGERVISLPYSTS